MPPSLVEMTVTWPDCTPDVALEFVKERTGEPLKMLGVRVSEERLYDDWDEVHTTAAGLGVEFSWGRAW